MLAIISVVLGLAVPAQAQIQDKTMVPGTGGIRIQNVDPGSVYESMKAEPGDVLLEVDDRRIQRIQEIEEIFRDIEPGHKVRVKIEHNGKVEERDVEVKRPVKAKTQPSPTPKVKK